MHREGEEIHVSEEEAKAGSKGSFLFQVLVISMAVVLAVMVGLYVFGTETSVNNGGAIASEAAAQ